MVYVLDADTAGNRETLTLDDLSGMEWVASSGGRARDVLPKPAELVMSQSELMGFEPRVVVPVESFLAVPALIAGTARVALVHRDIATRASESLPLRIFDCPFEAMPVIQCAWWHPMCAWWHPMNHSDRGINGFGRACRRRPPASRTAAGRVSHPSDGLGTSNASIAMIVRSVFPTAQGGGSVSGNHVTHLWSPRCIHSRSRPTRPQSSR